MSSQSLCSKEGPEDEVLKFSKALVKWGSVFCQRHQVGSIFNDDKARRAEDQPLSFLSAFANHQSLLFTSYRP